jgi:hypothetical protein
VNLFARRKTRVEDETLKPRAHADHVLERTIDGCGKEKDEWT